LAGCRRRRKDRALFQVARGFDALVATSSFGERDGVAAVVAREARAASWSDEDVAELQTLGVRVMGLHGVGASAKSFGTGSSRDLRSQSSSRMNRPVSVGGRRLVNLDAPLQTG